MKKIGIVLAVLILFFIWDFVSIYHHILTEKQSKATQAVLEAKKDFSIHKVLSTEAFRGQSAYEVLQAQLTDGKIMWIFMPEGKKIASPVTAQSSDGYTKQEIGKGFKSNVPYKSILSIKLGLDAKQNPTWEVIYIDPEGNYVFSYYDFYTGKSMSRPIALKS